MSVQHTNVVMLSSTLHLRCLAPFKHVVSTHPDAVSIYGPNAIISIRSLSFSLHIYIYMVSKQWLRIWLSMVPEHWCRVRLCIVPKQWLCKAIVSSLSEFVLKAVVPCQPIYIYRVKVVASSIVYVGKKEWFRTCLHAAPKHGVEFMSIWPQRMFLTWSNSCSR